jgi:hypothetical protein
LVECRSLSSSLCRFLHSPVTSSLLGPNILLGYPILKHPQPLSCFVYVHMKVQNATN